MGNSHPLGHAFYNSLGVAVKRGKSFRIARVCQVAILIAELLGISF